MGCVLVLEGESASPRSERWQFRLIRLFALTTVAAVLLGVFSRLPIDDDQAPHLLYEAAVLAILPLQVGYCVLARARFATMVIVAFATVVALGALLSLTLPAGDLLSQLWMTMLQSLMIHAAASIAQQAGYRIEETSKK